MLFRLREKAGSHTGLDNKVYHAGDDIESELDLVELFGSKFECIEDRKSSRVAAEVKPDIPTAKRVRGEDTVSDPASVEEGWDSDKYTNVTDEFEDTEEADVTVYREGRNKFYVVDNDDGALYHEEKFLSKKQVPQIIAGIFED